GAVAGFAVADAVLEIVFASAGSAPHLLKSLPALKSDDVLADSELLLTCDIAEFLVGQRACDARAVDEAARRLLSSGDGPLPVIPGLPAAVLLAPATGHLWNGRHGGGGGLLGGALAGGRRDALAGLELEGLAMMAFVESYWSRTNRARDAAARAHALSRHKNLTIPPA